MRLPWLIIKLVPWRRVIEHAPDLIASAKNLMASQSRAQRDIIDIAPVGVGTPLDRLQALEAACTQMHGQLQAGLRLSAELEQHNATLAHEIKRLRSRIRWAVIAGAGVGTIFALAILF